MRFSPRFLVLAVAVGAASLGCSSPSDPEGVRSIQTTTSFGFCIGYCETTLVITPNELVFTEQGTRQQLPPVRRTAAVSAAEWDGLVQAVNRQALEALPATVGCPDCADGGAESIEVIGDSWQKRVTFDFGANMPELQPLLARVRALRGRFQPTR
jgi:hypothetical protein